MKWRKIRVRRRRVAVVGCGKLGLPLVAVLANAGHEVIGFDSNDSLIKSLTRGKVPWFEASLNSLLELNSKRIRFTSEPKETFKEIDFALVIVPSPSDSSGVFESRFVEDAIISIAQEYSGLGKKRVRIVIISTLMPGSTDEIHKKLVSQYSDFDANFELIYSPEFIALGSVVHDMTHPDLVLIGARVEESANEYAELVTSYIKSTPHFAILTPKEAEIAKIAVNSYVTTKISFANFISELCEATGGASASKVLMSIGSDNRIGRSYLKPGAPFGGPCFPRDNIALERFASSVGISASLAISTHEVNQRQSSRIVSFIEESSDLSEVVLVGIAYKPGTAVTDESPSFAIIRKLEGKRNVFLIDDYVSADHPLLSERAISRAQLKQTPVIVVLMVPDEKYDNIPGILHEKSVVIDLWGKWESTATKLGLDYHRMGDISERNSHNRI